MPDLYGPFDPQYDSNGDPIPGTGIWAQEQWYRFAPTWAPSGVVGSVTSASSTSAGALGLTVSGRDISMALGRAWVQGAGYERTGTPWTFSVPANTASNPRTDALVLRRDLGAKTVVPVVLQGNPSVAPVAPTRQQDEFGQWDLPLFTWTTPANSGAPLTNITEQRVWVDTASGYGFSGGGGRIVAYGSMSTTQSTSNSTPVRLLGGLNLTPSLTPGRIYEYELSNHRATGWDLLLTVFALAGSTPPITGQGTKIGGEFMPSSNSANNKGLVTGKFAVATTGAYSISPFIATATNGNVTTFQTAREAVTVTAVIRDAGPTDGVPGTTPLMIP